MKGVGSVAHAVLSDAGYQRRSATDTWVRTTTTEAGRLKRRRGEECFRQVQPKLMPVPGKGEAVRRLRRPCVTRPIGGAPVWLILVRNARALSRRRRHFQLQHSTAWPCGRPSSGDASPVPQKAPLLRHFDAKTGSFCGQVWDFWGIGGDTSVACQCSGARPPPRHSCF